MGIGSSSSEVKEENPSTYDFGKAVDKSITSQEGNYLLYLFECKTNSDNNGGSLSIVLYNPVFSAKCFHLLELADTSEAKEKFRYAEMFQLLYVAMLRCLKQSLCPMLDRKAIMTMNPFMTGLLEYDIIFGMEYGTMGLGLECVLDYVTIC